MVEDPTEDFISYQRIIGGNESRAVAKFCLCPHFNSAAICLVSQSLGLSSPSLKSFMDPSIKINQHTVVLLRQNCDHVFYLKGSLLTCRNRRI